MYIAAKMRPFGILVVSNDVITAMNNFNSVSDIEVEYDDDRENPKIKY
jgi:hypothetical protein